jgi:hypothetical protein
MRRTARRGRPLVKIELELCHFSYLRVDMELRSGKLLLAVSPEAMANQAELFDTEKDKLLSQPPQSSTVTPGKSTLYQRAQALTRGYLWLCVASMVLILAAGILLFPQKTWNRMMLSLFGCITFNVRGKAYRFCEQPPVQQENGGIDL